MACICRCRCCRSCCSELWTIFRGWIILILYGAIGWFLFSYTEDDLNVIDCFRGLDVVAAKHYPDEAKRAELFFDRLEKLTNQTLSANESTAVYWLFYGTFKGSETVPYDRDLFSWNLCIKWYRFSVVTITAIGYGSITPKTDKGKMLVIPYALFGIPIVLAYLASIGSMVSKWTTSIMIRMHKLIKGNKPLKYKSLKHCLYMYIAMWVITVLAVLDFVFIPDMLKSWLDGLYFYFVTFTTIGFGDIVGPATEVSFYGVKLFFGLSIISGVVDSFLKFIEHVEIDVTCKSCSCRYIEEDNGDDANVENEQAIVDTPV